mmetsp:Transcript_22122/g.62013  ORF Transcript_22122/g.62013 Transcript_22122/m.62013 type:complete len:217 (-) Transcript_22122:1065-1715(-)
MIFPSKSRNTSVLHIVPSPNAFSTTSFTTPPFGSAPPFSMFLKVSSRSAPSAANGSRESFLDMFIKACMILNGSGILTAGKGALSPSGAKGSAARWSRGSPKAESSNGMGMPNALAIPKAPGPSKRGAPRRPNGSSTFGAAGRCWTCNTHKSPSRSFSKRSAAGIGKRRVVSLEKAMSRLRMSLRAAQSQTTRLPALRSTPQCSSKVGSSERTKGR